MSKSYRDTAEIIADYKDTQKQLVMQRDRLESLKIDVERLIENLEYAESSVEQTIHSLDILAQDGIDALSETL